MLMTTDPSDLVLDITCGSGTTAFVAEQWGRRWITCDTSRVALVLAKQRLMTATFGYFQLAKEEEGVASGFKYKTVPHVTLKSIANNEPPATETLYDQPLTDKTRARVTSPFTVEAVPAPVVQALTEFVVPPLGGAPSSEVEPPKGGTTNLPADNSIARSGESLRQHEWRSELLRTGIRGRRGEKMMFSRVEPIAGTRFLHADAELVESQESRVESEEEHSTLDSRLRKEPSFRLRPNINRCRLSKSNWLYRKRKGSDQNRSSLSSPPFSLTRLPRKISSKRIGKA